MNQHQTSKSLGRIKPWLGCLISTHCGMCRTPQRRGEAGNGIRLRKPSSSRWVGVLVQHTGLLAWPCLSRWTFPLCPVKENNSCVWQSPKCSVLGAISRQFISLPTVQCFLTEAETLPDILTARRPERIPRIFTGILTQKCTSVGKKLKKHKQTGEIN